MVRRVPALKPALGLALQGTYTCAAFEPHALKLLGQRFGLKDDMAKQVLATIAESSKKKLPSVLAGQIDGLLAGEIADLHRMIEVGKGLGSPLGGGKE